MSALKDLKKQAIRKKIQPYEKNLVRTLGSDLWEEVLSFVTWADDESDIGIALDVEMPNHVRASLSVTRSSIELFANEMSTQIASGEDFALKMIDCELDANASQSQSMLNERQVSAYERIALALSHIAETLDG